MPRQSPKWKNTKPGAAERTKMLKRCGSRCFLGPKKSFPVCNKGTCKINHNAVKSATRLAKRWGKSKSAYKGKKAKPRHPRYVYTNVVRKSKKLLR